MAPVGERRAALPHPQLTRRRVALVGVKVALTQDAAKALNQAFGTSALTTGATRRTHPGAHRVSVTSVPRRKPSTDPGRRGRRPSGAPPIDPYAGERQRRQREICAAKARYATEAEARAHALMHQPGPGSRPSTYLCEICSGWHFTSRR